MKTRKLFAMMVFVFPLIIVSCGKNEMDDTAVLHDYRVQNVLYPKDSKLKTISYVESVKSKKGGIIINQYDYDELGRISKVSQPMYKDGTSIFENGTIVGLYSYSDYVYNNDGLLDRIISYHSNIYAGFQNLETHTYSYDKSGNKLKTLIEYPIINATDSILYFYEGNRLVRENKYRYGTFFDGNNNAYTGLCTYIKYEYDNQGNLVKEDNYSRVNDTPVGFSVHSYQNGLNVKTEAFVSSNVIEKTPLREIRRYYDKNDNLIYLESIELSIFSSAMGYVAKYEYY